MDTPERNKIAAPLAPKFEDSPVFNYINSLSPIQPVRSTHTVRSFTSLSFASLPSVFTSPHIKFVNRHQNQDSSKPENPSEKDGNISSNNSLAGPQENLDPSVPTRAASVEPPSGHSNSALELPQTLAYDHGSPSINPTPCAVETTLPSANPSSEGEVHQEGTCQTEQVEEMASYEWESLISDGTDLLIFNSPDNTEALKELLQRSLDRGSRFRASLVSECPPDGMNAEHSTLLVDPDGSVQQYGTDEPSSQHGDASDIQVDGLGNTALEQYLASNANDTMNNEPISDLHRGMRRRCLDFEVAVAHRKNIGVSRHCKFEESIALTDQHQVDAKPSGVSLRPILPGIGLHLNALAATSKDSKILKCGRQIISLSTSDSPTATQEPLSKSFTDARGRDDAEGGIQTMEDASRVSPYLLTEEFNQNIPEKKRLKLEQVSETTETSCKRCNCKKSKCLKLYCECFAAGLYCVEPCSCQGCFNKPIHEDTVLATRKQIESRNPLAFAPKVIRSSDSLPEIGEESSKTPASARHKRGCNCKKSSCLKKYCECYQGGVGCSVDCRCEGCKNIFGRKDGCSLLGPECEQEEESELVDKALQKSENQNNDRNSTSGVPMTPLQLYRPLTQLPHSSKGKPPLPAIGSTSGAYTIQKFGRRSSMVRSESKFEKQSERGPEDEVLQENTSPSRGAVVQTGSPNSKRVSSSPHCNSSSSPTKRNGRKLILQSIPSFPSLTQH